ncbi:MAG: glycoside hydrolase family 78 protein [Myxococcota bacterium]|nr:glycoside hydrolase family 78 protein [Myxococcota bacterium]
MRSVRLVRASIVARAAAAVVVLALGCSSTSSPPESGAANTSDGSSGVEPPRTSPGADGPSAADATMVSGDAGPDTQSDARTPGAAGDGDTAGSVVPLSDGSASPLSVTHLRCELNVDPLQVETLTPRLTWELQSSDATVRGERQTAFEVLVGSSPQVLSTDTGDVWSSGPMASGATRTVYAGPPLASLTRVYWKVRVRDAEGRLSGWSAPAEWTQGIVSAGDWGAQWITPAATSAGLPLFRRELTVTKPLRRALLSVCGLGQYELRVNGTNASDGVLDPGWTNFGKTCLYRTYDVTSALQQGPNALGVLLGNGMYSVTTTGARYSKFTGSFGPLKLIARLQMAFTDGSQSAIVSDASWRVSPGPITFSNIYGGEDFDAQSEPVGWDHAGFNDTSWSPPAVVTTVAPALVAQGAPQVKVMQTFVTKNVAEPLPGVFVFDLGQNFSGWPLLDVTGTGGAVVRLTPGELLTPQGTVTQASMGGPIWFEYKLRGGSTENWHPRFSYTGFRYVQVDGGVPAARAAAFPGRPVVTLAGQFIHTSAEPAGDFKCSDPDVNNVHALILASMRSNLQSLLTDCPQREKLGWLETSHLMGRAMMFNLDLQTLYEQEVANMREAQTATGLVPDIAPEVTTFAGDFRDSPEWGSAYVVDPWNVFQMYGDPTILEHDYGGMKRYVDYLGSRAAQGLLSYGLGDWYDVGPAPPGRSQLTSAGVTATGVLFEDATILQKSAALFGHPADATHYAALAASAAAAYQSKFWNAAGYYDRGSQTANAVALATGIAPAASQAPALGALVQSFAGAQYRVTAGDIGFAYVVRALSDAGRADVLLSMLKQRAGPGYLYQVDHGATALTEAWNAFSQSSQNHVMLGHAERWLWEGLAGFNTDESSPGFARAIVKPQMPAGIDSVTATHATSHGVIESAWTRHGAGVELIVTVPVNTVATVYVPTGSPATVTESGVPVGMATGVTAVRPSPGALAVDVGSGRYDFMAN